MSAWLSALRASERSSGVRELRSASAAKASASMPIGKASMASVRPKPLSRPSFSLPAAEMLDGVAGEVLAVAHRLEADQVVGEEGARELLVMRQRREDLGRREGDVEEEADRVGHLPLAQIGGERDELVVVHPDRVVGVEERRDLLGEAPVDGEIGRFRAGAQIGEVEPVVEERPEAAVGEAEIIAVVLLRRSAPP